MSLTFRKATKSQAKLRMALIGPAGSGKTYSALAVATALGDRVAVIDTEHSSASKYADVFSFDTLNLDEFTPETYVEAIRAAEEAGYDVIVIDSLSHAWAGKGGALDLANDETKRSRSGNSYAAWRNVTPKHNALVEAIIGSKCHVLATMRAKTEYAQEKGDNGKTVIRKVGLAPIQKDGLEYEFDLSGDMDQENNYIVSKSRCPKLTGKIIPRPGRDLAAVLKAWLSDGAPAPEPKPELVKVNGASLEQALQASTETWDEYARRVESLETLDDCDALEKEIRARLPEGSERKALGKRFMDKKRSIQSFMAANANGAK